MPSKKILQRERRFAAPTVGQGQICQWTPKGSKRVGLEACEGITDSQVKFYTSCNCIHLTGVKIYRMSRRIEDMAKTSEDQAKRMIGNGLRLFYIVKLCSFDFDSGIALNCLLSNLVADMFSFAIAVSPNKENFTVSRLCFNISCNSFLVLHPDSANFSRNK